MMIVILPLVIAVDCTAADVGGAQLAVVRADAKTVDEVHHIYEIDSRVGCELDLASLGVRMDAPPTFLAGPQGWKSEFQKKDGGWTICWKQDPGSRQSRVRVRRFGKARPFLASFRLGAALTPLGWKLTFKGGLEAKAGEVTDCSVGRAIGP